MGKQNSFIDFKFHAYLFNDIHLKEIPDLIKEGVTSAKLLLGSNEEEAKRSGRHAIGLDYAYRVMDVTFCVWSSSFYASTLRTSRYHFCLY